jgi:hypothetical protein
MYGRCPPSGWPEAPSDVPVERLNDGVRAIVSLLPT